MTGQAATPKQMARKLVRVLRPQRPDHPYLKKVFQHTRELLGVKPSKTSKRLPELLTDSELVGFYETVWHARNSVHMVMIKLLIFTGLRNAELSQIRLKHIDVDQCQIRIEQGKGKERPKRPLPGEFPRRTGAVYEPLQGAASSLPF